MRATGALAAVLLALIAACSAELASNEGPRVDVVFDPGMPRSARDLAVRVEVYLVESCDSVALGVRPVEAAATAHALRDGDSGTLGTDFAPGSYGVYAVAQDANCAVVAAGCNPATIPESLDGVLMVSLSAFPAEGCTAAQQCDLNSGNCIDGGGTGGTGGGGNTGGTGAGGSAGTGGTGGVPVDCSVEPDETPCSSEGAIGLCRAGACCTGCWDGGTCHGGDEPVRCGAGGQLCVLCECFSDACVAGACKPVPTFTEIDAGYQHMCGVDEDGALWCWGSDRFGEIGVGVGPQRDACGADACFMTPIEMTTMVAGSAPTWAEVSAGEDVTCAIRGVDSSLWCWGSNADARMGAPDTVTSAVEPTLVSPGIYQSVDNEDKNACALRTDGTLWCWGQNAYGEVGQGYTGSDVYGPLQVPYANDWTELTNGDQHVCAIQQERMWCWGYNGDGPLGNGETGGATHPATNGFIGSRVDAGLFTTCALDSMGVGHCWGQNNYGQAGIGDDTGDDVLDPTSITGALSFDHFSVGQEFACAVTNSGGLYCWGRNIYEKLGIGELYADVSQVEVPTRLGTDSDWAQVSTGQHFGCALRGDGSVWCWGRNNLGQLGQGDTTKRIFPTRLCF